MSWTGRDSYTGNASAMIGIELFGGCFDWIGDGNTITRMCTGLEVVGLEQSFAPAGINPCFFNYFVNNAVQSCYEGIYLGCSIPVRTSSTGIALLGNLFRDNTLSGIAGSGAGLNTSTPSTPGIPVDMTLFDRNTLHQSGGGDRPPTS